MTALKWGVLAVALTVSSLAVAQESLGELTAMGAQKIEKGELVGLLSGLVMTGDSFNNAGGVIHFEYQGDGTVSGFLRTADGKEFRSSGKWSVDDSGKFCRDMIRESNGSRWGDCRFFYKHGDAYFATDPNNPSAKVERRTFTKK